MLRTTAIIVLFSIEPPLLYGVESPGVKRIALENPEQTQRNAFPEPLLLDGLHSVVRTRRMEPALGRDVGRQQQSIEPEHENGYFCHSLTAFDSSKRNSALTAFHVTLSGIPVTLTE
jgi:hypothetical protein